MSRGSGRGGRGRGGASKSLNREQLSSLGVLGNDLLPVPVTQPPPVYPIIDRKPIPLQPSVETDYLLILKQDFIDRMQLSASYLKMPEISKQPQQEIDKLVAQLPSVKEKFDWRLFPTELRPKISAKRIKKQNKINVDVTKKLEQLEKMEEGSEVEETKEENEQVEDKEEDEIVEEEQDEEMDDGTDYANNYFDNGEDYEDENDDLDDGPIY